MTAPATHHDLRCVQASSPDPSVPCTCARGAVLRMPLRPDPRACLMCGQPPSWEINRKRRSCSRCLADALADFYATDWDGFVPAIVSPIRTGGAA